MCILPQDRRFLSHALALATEAAAFASPNPTVGCVLTRDHDILGAGAHRYDARDHAEIVALKQAAAKGLSTRRATAYATLEPCSHHGRTGPCCDALIEAGIARCVVATVDPNPKVSGAGIARMVAAGIVVDVLSPHEELAQNARRLNDAFAFSIQRGRPFVTLKAALSVDGKLAPPPSRRSTVAPHWLTGEAARADVQQLRHESDAILTGIGTVLADDPLLTDRTGLPRRRNLLRVVLDSSLRTPLDSKLVQTAADGLLLVCQQNAPHDAETALRNAGAEVLRLRDERVKLDRVLEVLAQRQILSVMVEAGAAVNGSFLSEGLVDKLVLYYSEAELGMEAMPFANGQASPYVLQQRLMHTTRQAFPHGDSEDIRIAGYMHDSWSNVGL